MKAFGGAALAAFALAMTACSGGNSSSLSIPNTPPQSAQAAQNAPLSVTVTRSAATATSSAQRSAEFIPASAQSVKMDVYIGTLTPPAANTAFVPPASGPFSSVCQNFPVGQSSVTLGSTAPLGADTVVITAYNVPCTPASGLTTANIASQFVGNGSVTAAGGTVASIFNGGAAVSLAPAAPVTPPVLLSVTATGSAPTTPANMATYAYTSIGQTITVTATEANYTGPSFSAVSSDATVATVAPAAPATATTTSTGAASFVVTATGGSLAAGATITISDGLGNRGVLTVTVPLGSVTAGYSTTFGASSQPTASPAALVIPAASLTASITTPSQSNYSGLYTAAVSPATCTQVSVSPTTASAGPFTVTANAAVAAGTCSVTITGKTGSTPWTLPVSVTAASGSVQIRWIPPQGLAVGAQPPVANAGAPINIVGAGSTFTTTVIATELNYLGAFTLGAVPAGCTGLTVTPIATPSPIPAGLTLQPGQGVQFYSMTTTGSFASASCSITVTDALANSASAPVVSTSSTGTFQ